MLIAIDPGASGGIASYNNGITVAVKMPDTDSGKVEYLRTLKGIAADEKVRCIMEKVSGYIGGRMVDKQMVCPKCRSIFSYQEKQADPGSFMFTFGDGFGLLKGTILSLGFRYEEYTPIQWMNMAGIRKEKGETKNSWKNRLKDRAQKLYPEIKVTLSTADALIILDVAKRITF